MFSSSFPVLHKLPAGTPQKHPDNKNNNNNQEIHLPTPHLLTVNKAPQPWIVRSLKIRRPASQSASSRMKPRNYRHHSCNSPDRIPGQPPEPAFRHRRFWPVPEPHIQNRSSGREDGYSSILTVHSDSRAWRGRAADIPDPKRSIRTARPYGFPY